MAAAAEAKEAAELLNPDGVDEQDLDGFDVEYPDSDGDAY